MVRLLSAALSLVGNDDDADDLNVGLFSKGGDLKVKKISAWQMKSIYPKAATELKENTQ